MDIHYNATSGGDIALLDEATDRIVILSDSHWTTTSTKFSHDIYRFHPQAKVSMPENIFNGAYAGIKRYHKQGSENQCRGYDSEEVLQLKKHITSLEMQIIEILKKEAPSSVKNFLTVKDLVHS